MFGNLFNRIKKIGMGNNKEENTNKDEARKRLHLVLLQDRADVSADFLDMMTKEIVDVIKKYVDVDEGEIEIELTNKQNSDGTIGAPALYANIPIKSIKNSTRAMTNKDMKSIEKEADEKKKKQAKLESKKNETKKEKVSEEVTKKNVEKIKAEVKTMETENKDIENKSENNKNKNADSNNLKLENSNENKNVDKESTYKKVTPKTQSKKKKTNAKIKK